MNHQLLAEVKELVLATNVAQSRPLASTLLTHHVLDMAHIMSLPNEILQKIASHFSVRAKYSFLRTQRQAQRAFVDDAVEKAEIWDLLFKDHKWLQKMESEGALIALVGADLRFMTDGHQTRPRGLVVAVVLIWPKGKGLTKAINPNTMPERPAERRKFWDENPALYKKWLSDRRQIHDQTTKGLLASLRSSYYDDKTSQVEFDGFHVHVGPGIGTKGLWFDYIERLLLPGESRTLVLYYNGGPAPFSYARVKNLGTEDGVVTVIDDHSEERVAWFFEAADL